MDSDAVLLGRSNGVPFSDGVGDAMETDGLGEEPLTSTPED